MASVGPWESVGGDIKFLRLKQLNVNTSPPHQVLEESLVECTKKREPSHTNPAHQVLILA
jgi:hypothetical protein